MEHPCSLVLTDLRLPGISGLDLIKEIRKKDLPVTVIVMTGFATVEDTVEAIKLGAYDLVQKPLDTVSLEVLVNHALEDRRLIDEVADLRCRLQRKSAYHNLLGQSPGMTEVFERVAASDRRRAPSSSRAKPARARSWSRRRFISATSLAAGRWSRSTARHCPSTCSKASSSAMNAGPSPAPIARKKGGSNWRREELCFLDEIGEMPLGMQAKLLRVLQDGRFERVGGTDPIQTDCRVIAATNIVLAEAVAAGRFREDLFYRLNVVSIEVPPLRERLEDIPLLVNHFLDKMADKGLPPRRSPDRLSRRLMSYDWPGNVRELEHALEQATVTTSGPLIEPENLPPQIVARHDEPFHLDFDHRRPLAEITADFTCRIERAYLQRVLEKYRGRVELCAQHCGLSRRSISEKLRRYQIDKRDFKLHPSRRKSVALTAE